MDIYTVAIVISLIVYIAVGNYAGRRVKKLEDYFVAGRNAPTVLIVGTLVASLISTNAFLGETGFVYDGQAGNIVGFVNIYEVLSSSEKFSDLRESVKPIHRLSGDTTVTEAIDVMQREGHKIVLVTRGGRERPIGIVTMKDLAEELLGELAEW